MNADGREVSACLKVLRALNQIKEDDAPSKIEEGLFLGSMGAAHNKSALISLNVTHILTLASISPPYPNDFTYKAIKVTDSGNTNIAQYFDECFDFIDEAKCLGGGVLVHCYKGRSRSVTVVIAYLMKKYHMSYIKAIQLVKERRPRADPNFGFIMQLRKLEKLLGDAQR